MDIKINPAALAPTLGVDDLAPTAPGVADPSAVSRFDDAMEPAADVTEALRAGAPEPAGGGTLGDHILGGLQHLSADLKDSWSKVDAMLKGRPGDLGARELLQMQLGISTMSFQYELVSKAVSRSTQNIDQLVKLQ